MRQLLQSTRNLDRLRERQQPPPPSKICSLGNLGIKYHTTLGQPSTPSSRLRDNNRLTQPWKALGGGWLAIWSCCVPATRLAGLCPRFGLVTYQPRYRLSEAGVCIPRRWHIDKPASLFLLLVGASHCAPPCPGLVSAEMWLKVRRFSHHFPFLWLSPQRGGVLRHEVVMRSSVSSAGSVSRNGKGGGRTCRSAGKELVPARVVVGCRRRPTRPIPSGGLFCRLSPPNLAGLKTDNLRSHIGILTTATENGFVSHSENTSCNSWYGIRTYEYGRSQDRGKPRQKRTTKRLGRPWPGPRGRHSGSLHPPTGLSWKYNRISSLFHGARRGSASAHWHAWGPSHQALA